MKEIKLNYSLTSEIQTDENGAALQTSVNDILLLALKNAPIGDSMSPGGMNFEAMGSRIDILKKLAKAASTQSNSIILENTEHATLISALKTTRYTKIDPVLYDYIDSIVKLPEAVIATEKPAE